MGTEKGVTPEAMASAASERERHLLVEHLEGLEFTRAQRITTDEDYREGWIVVRELWVKAVPEAGPMTIEIAWHKREEQ